MITKFKLFGSLEDIRSICKMYGIQNWELNPKTGLVDVLGDVNLTGRGLKKLPLKFGDVGGDFYCGDNQLTSLEGVPEIVNGSFLCYGNQLTSLKGIPKTIGGGFYCSNNQLTSLEGSPKSVSEDFYCHNNQLTSLEGSPKSVSEDFCCHNNQLTSLEGSPKSVSGNFYCHNNQLTKFTGIPEYSLNEEKSFYCINNPIYEIYKLFNTPKCIDLINEYGAIGDGQISRVKLEEVFLELEMDIPRDLEFRNYKLIG